MLSDLNDHFYPTARRYFKNEVVIKENGDMIIARAAALYGSDAMPEFTSSYALGGLWTYVGEEDGAIRFFFINLNDAVDFKLRFG